MKKLIAFVVVLMVGLCCKKSDELICGCSIYVPVFSFIIKNHQNADMLSAATQGAYPGSALKLQYKNASGVLSEIPYIIREPFSYENNGTKQFAYRQIHSSAIVNLRHANAANEFYVNLGNGDVDTLSFDFDMAQGRATNVKFNNQTETLEPSFPADKGAIFFLLK